MTKKKTGILTFNIPQELNEKIEQLNLSPEEENEFIAKILRLAVDSYGELPKIRYYPLKRETVTKFLSCPKVYVLVDCKWALDNKVFHLEADDFLQFAKNYYHDLCPENRINIISLLKKAIDSQIDWLLTYFGYNYRTFNEKNYPFCKDFVKKYTTVDGSYKLRFLDALGVFDISSIEVVRKIRNRLEHEYRCPTIKETKNAIKLTEEFLKKCRDAVYEKCITTCHLSNKQPIGDNKLNSEYIDIAFKPNYLKSKITISYVRDKKIYRFYLTPLDEEYLDVLKSLLTENFEYFLSKFAHEAVIYEISYC